MHTIYTHNTHIQIVEEKHRNDAPMVAVKSISLITFPIT